MTLESEFNINQHEKKIYSQNGEDGIIEYIFSKIGTTNKFSVEFGVGDGFESNTVFLLEKKNWKGLMMDYGSDQKIQLSNIVKKAWSIRKLGLKKNIQKYVAFIKKIINRKKRSKNFNLDIKHERVTAENIQNLFKKYNVPIVFDLLSIDIDYNDYWVWKSIVDYSPRVVIIEYNSSILPTESKVVPYDPEAIWDGTNYFGASLLALKNLGSKKGYTLVGCDSNGVNAFFCKSDLLKNFYIKDIDELYHPPQYGEIINGIHIGHPISDKKMIEI
ncbi:hypothetical protein Nlim_1983 [Candidatus Nitrosarchaeum limnium SFB1]|jgi:hypothetical protein|uniref:Methyltransferase FkbM domain-containing protein n=1 Tax=Candidatus Nitrosarchaeum limnium SFB1 TaxID=886738 RepID=F3KNK1_9ARCH|nr:hypothetical protein Nlim_1983 [Candidatus Nitrosarchaeum limnium SFB1]